MDLNQAAAEYRTISHTLRQATRPGDDPASLDGILAEREAIAAKLEATDPELLVYLTVEDVLTSAIGEWNSVIDRATLADVRDHIVARLELAGGVQRGFPAEIYVGPYHSPDGGISATAKRVTVLSVRGRTLDQEFRLSAPTVDAPAVHIVSRGTGYLVAIPATPVPGGRVGYMASEALVHSGDIRWNDLVGRSVVHLHDRTETGATADVLSR